MYRKSKEKALHLESLFSFDRPVYISNFSIYISTSSFPFLMPILNHVVFAPFELQMIVSSENAKRKP